MSYIIKTRTNSGMNQTVTTDFDALLASMSDEIAFGVTAMVQK